jgi:hypothetical protein
MNSNELMKVIKACGIAPNQGSTTHAISMFTLIVSDDNWRGLVDDILQNLSSRKDIDPLVELLIFIQPEAAIDQMWAYVDNVAVESNWLLQEMIPQCANMKNLRVGISHAEKSYGRKEVQQCVIDSVEQLLVQATVDEEEIQDIILRSNLPPETVEAIQDMMMRHLPTGSASPIA